MTFSIFPKPQQNSADLIFNGNVGKGIVETLYSNQFNKFCHPTSLGGIAKELVGLGAFKDGI